MPDQPAPPSGRSLWKYSSALALSWVLLLSASVWVQINQAHKSIISSALNAARTAFQKDVALRSWVSSQGGVYVPAPLTRQNPHLTPNREVTPTEGQRLTFLNPTDALGQVEQRYQDLFGIYGHVTRLKRLDNAPNPWELEALTLFKTKGYPELWRTTEEQGVPFLQMALPLFMAPDCLQCNAQQSYQGGTVQGGLVVSVPLQPYRQMESQFKLTQAAFHGLFLLAGWLVIGLFSWVLNRYLARLEASESALESHQKDLVAEVARQTSEAQTARKKAETATAFKAEFLANMSHEIRTPLTGVLGVTTLLEQTRLDAEQKNLLTMVQYSGEHLMLIVNEVLDFSKLEAGKQTLNPSLVNLVDLVESTFNMFALEAAVKKVRLLYLIHPSCPDSVQVDKKRLQQILINLVSNSLKYTESGEVVLQVESKQEKVQLTLTFSVQDTGCGIQPEDLGHLFDAYAQAKEGAQPGTGLGLKITKDLVELFGGKITVTSKIDEGSRFEFLIHAKVGSKQSELPDSVKAQLNHSVLLVASPTPNFFSALSNQLTPLGCVVASVSSPQEVIHAQPGEKTRLLMIDSPLVETQDSPWLTHWDELNLPVIVNLFIGSPLPLPKNAIILHKPLKTQALYQALCQAKVPKEGLPPTKNPFPELKTTQILLVEDHEINQMVGQKILESLGYLCEVAADGEKAIVMAKQHTFDLILMDIRMPIMNGVEATQAILADPDIDPKPIIIAMTADVLEENRQTYLQAGMRDMLSKPLVPKDLQRCLSHWTRTQQKQKHIETLTPSNGPRELLNHPLIQSRRAIGGGFFTHLRAYFCNIGQDVMKQLEEACNRGDDLLCIELAHQLKGLAENIGGDLMAQNCYNLEISANNLELDRVFEQISLLQDLFTRTCKELQKKPE